MLKSVLTNAHGVLLAAKKYWLAKPNDLDLDGVVLLTASPSAMHGTFKSATRAGAGTTTITTPDASGSLLITDIVISGEKVALGTTEVLFTDGTNTVTIFLTEQQDGAVNLSVAFVGRVQGWRGARIDMTTVATHDTTVLVCYTKIPDALPFAEWDALR